MKLSLLFLSAVGLSLYFLHLSNQTMTLDAKPEDEIATLIPHPESCLCYLCHTPPSGPLIPIVVVERRRKNSWWLACRANRVSKKRVVPDPQGKDWLYMPHWDYAKSYLPLFGFEPVKAEAKRR